MQRGWRETWKIFRENRTEVKEQKRILVYRDCEKRKNRKRLGGSRATAWVDPRKKRGGNKMFLESNEKVKGKKERKQQHVKRGRGAVKEGAWKTQLDTTRANGGDHAGPGVTFPGGV